MTVRLDGRSVEREETTGRTRPLRGGVPDTRTFTRTSRSHFLSKSRTHTRLGLDSTDSWWHPAPSGNDTLGWSFDLTWGIWPSSEDPGDTTTYQLVVSFFFSSIHCSTTDFSPKVTISSFATFRCRFLSNITRIKNHPSHPSHFPPLRTGIQHRLWRKPTRRKVSRPLHKRRPPLFYTPSSYQASSLLKA